MINWRRIPMQPMPLLACDELRGLPYPLMCERDLVGRRIVVYQARKRGPLTGVYDSGYTRRAPDWLVPLVHAVARSLDHHDLALDGIVVREGGRGVFVWRDILTGQEWRRAQSPLVLRERWAIMRDVARYLDWPGDSQLRLATYEAALDPAAAARESAAAGLAGASGLLLYDPEQRYQFGDPPLFGGTATHRACWRIRVDAPGMQIG